MVGKLRQAASSGLKLKTGNIVTVDDDPDDTYEEVHWFGSKADAVVKFLEEHKPPGEKVLIFSEFPNTLKAIKQRLPCIGLQSSDLLTSSANRGKAIRDFQGGPPTHVFVCTYRAGGAGVSLTAGTYIVLCEPTLNPSQERQAIGRSHRIGQDTAVTVTRFVMKGTIEEKVRQFVREQLEEEHEQHEEPLSTAMETNLDLNNESNKLRLETLKDWLMDVPDEA
ncbi:hypothetical protein ABPG75_008041 [Micractinium tetrahymenae]